MDGYESKIAAQCTQGRQQRCVCRSIRSASLPARVGLRIWLPCAISKPLRQGTGAEETFTPLGRHHSVRLCRTGQGSRRRVAGIRWASRSSISAPSPRCCAVTRADPRGSEPHAESARHGIARCRPMVLSCADHVRRQRSRRRAPSTSAFGSRRTTASRSTSCTGSSATKSILEFEPGETFIGLGCRRHRGLAFVGQENHLFLKPKGGQSRDQSDRAHQPSALSIRLHRACRSGRRRGRTSSMRCGSRIPPIAAQSQPMPGEAPRIATRRALRPVDRRTSTIGIAATPALQTGRVPPMTVCTRGCALPRTPICRRFSCAMTMAASRCSISAWTPAMSSFIAWRGNSFCGAASSPDASSIRDMPAAAGDWNRARWRRMSNGGCKEVVP